MKFIAGMIAGMVVLAGVQMVGDRAVGYVVQDAHYAEADCGCGYYSEMGFDAPKGDVIISFKGCLCE